MLYSFIEGSLLRTFGWKIILACDIKEMETLGEVPHFKQHILGHTVPTGARLYFNRVHAILMLVMHLNIIEIRLTLTSYNIPA